MISLVKRHLLVFLRDKWSVFFSLLSVLIVILLYTLFLIKMHDTSLPEALQGTTEAQHLTYTWLFSGVLMVSTVTVPLGFLGTMIRDRTERISNDFYVTPLKRLSITLSYLIAAFIITVMLALVNLISQTGCLLVLQHGYVVDGAVGVETHHHTYQPAVSFLGEGSDGCPYKLSILPGRV